LLSVPLLSIAQSIVYDNTSNPVSSGGQQLFYPSANEFGDQITLAGTDRTLSQFTFYYYFSGASPGGSAVIHFYENTGAGGSPNAASFYNSDPITLSPGYNNQTIDFSSASPVTLPNSFTWTIQFSSLGGNQAGLLVYGPPTVGSSFTDFWENSGGTWSTMGITGQPSADFAARVTAVPEPGTLAIGALALLIGAVRFRSKLRR
jgi:hypothetical protein